MLVVWALFGCCDFCCVVDEVATPLEAGLVAAAVLVGADDTDAAGALDMVDCSGLIFQEVSIIMREGRPQSTEI